MFVNTLRVHRFFYSEVFKRQICATLPCMRKNWEQNGAFDGRRHASLLSLNPAPGSSAVAAKDDIKQFLSIYPDVINDLTKACCTDNTLEFEKYYERMLNQVLPNYRIYGVGQSLATAYKTLVPLEKQTAKDIHLANILGWCIEFMCAAIGVGDDIRDESETRHKVICWHRNEGVGLRAIADGIILEQGIYSVLKKHFSTHQYYVPIMDLFQEVNMETIMGQALDEIYIVCNGTPLTEIFTEEKYRNLVIYKTGYVSVLPTLLAMYLANIDNQKMHKDATTILLKIGHFWQVDNDVLDCFGEKSVFGHDSNDITEGRCTWLIVEALQKVSSEQMKILEENYGRPGTDCQKAVRDLYKELDLFNSYISYKTQTFEQIREDIKGIHYKPLQRLLYKFCDLPMGFEPLIAV